ncbi:hypothetical protein Pla110_28430 [Polystyrenella longa]|uniref:Uncharacterized protein n=1 Tax=Polystyrenella longa TaxID=2528007 RepID=A0A518CPF0_9PLAN|nr:hypothetical protein [Polystyrenella longa]QDU81106.1 hypothetical protein Pla110_28430 [Polystyrenella longa]
MSLRKLAVLALLIGLLPWVAGCGNGDDGLQEFEPSTSHEDDHDHDEHGHEEHGPHDGHLVDLGDHKYMAEVVFDAADHKVGVYILDHDEMKAYPIDQTEIGAHLHIGEEEQEFKLTAKPQEGDPEGKSSYFELAGNEIIKEHVTDAEDLEGEIIVTVDGETYEGEIMHHHDHDHDDHDH